VVRAARLDPPGELAVAPSESCAPSRLSEFEPLCWHLARPGESQRARIVHCLNAHHYLGYPDPLGQIHYLVQDRLGRDRACLLFGPAAWKVGPRDQWIGWSAALAGGKLCRSRALIGKPLPSVGRKRTAAPTPLVRVASLAMRALINPSPTTSLVHLPGASGSARHQQFGRASTAPGLDPTGQGFGRRGSYERTVPN
jgi:hypothetical protein